MWKILPRAEENADTHTTDSASDCLSLDKTSLKRNTKNVYVIKKYKNHTIAAIN